MTEIALLQAAIRQCEKIVFLTGAGVSVASGIPDYRSKGGLYDGLVSPEYILSDTCLAQEPAVFYQFVKENMYYLDAIPSVVHLKMAEISRRPSKNVTIITQNIDDLHDRAGSGNVIHFHGSLYDCYCQKCGEKVATETYLTSDHHQVCGGIIRPRVVLYGEPIPAKAIEEAVKAVRAAELIVIVGTSFVVQPFCRLTDYRQSTSQVFAVNKEPVHVVGEVTLIQSEAEQIFKAL